MLASWCLPSLRAQDDLFGDGDPFGGGDDFAITEPSGKTTTEASGKSKAVASPLTRQWLEQAATGNTRLADAVAALARTGRWEEINQLLSNLNPGTLSVEVKADMARRIGPTNFLKIKGRDDISDPAKLVLSELAQAQMTFATSPKRLTAAIKQLGSKNKDQRAAAARRLFAGGNAAIAALADQLTQPDPITAPRDLLAIYTRLGDHVHRPLERYALYGGDVRRENALVILEHLSPGSARLAALTALHAGDASDRERKIAANQLQQTLGRLPTVDQVTEALVQDFRRKRDAAMRVHHDGQTETLWTLQAKKKATDQDLYALRSAESTVLVSAYRDVVDSVARLKRLGQASDHLRPAMLAAELAYRILLDRDWGDPPQVASLQASFGITMDEAFLLTAMEQASGQTTGQTTGQAAGQGDPSAVLGLVRMIAADAHSPEGRLVPTSLLQGGSTLSPLVALAAHATDPRIRYEAALITAHLASDPDHPGKRVIAYAGSSAVSKTLSEMRSLSDRPHAILVETRPEVALFMESLLTDLGYDVTVVPSVSRLLSAVARGGDLRLIVSKTQLWDMPPIELVDRVRRTPRGRDVPMVLYHDDQQRDDRRGEDLYGQDLQASDLYRDHSRPVRDVRLGEDRWNAPTLEILMPASVAAFDGALDETKRLDGVPKLTPVDRRDFRRRAIELLGIN